MTREETRKARIVMQHFEDGGEVQILVHDYDGRQEWEDCPNPDWNWDYHTYRIKPQSMKVTEEEKEIISKPPIFWAKHKETGKVDCFFNRALHYFGDTHYILNPDTMEWEDRDANADSRHNYNGGQP